MKWIENSCESVDGGVCGLYGVWLGIEELMKEYSVICGWICFVDRDV